MKKLLALVLSMLFVIAVMPISVSANTFIEGILHYKIVNDEAIITSCWDEGRPITGDLIIPQSFSNDGKTYPVTTISKEAFSSVDYLTTLTIPSSVIKFEPRAFAHANVETLNIQSNITKIENSVFESSNIKNINLPESITEIGDSAFKSSKFQSINLPKNLKKIGANAFNGSAIENINIPSGVTQIGSKAFYSSNLKSINIPDSVTEIGSEAFENCLELTYANLGKGITTVKESTFHYCPSLKTVVIPNTLVKIEKSAFSNCFVLENITLGENIGFIGEYAFVSCRALKSITIPNKVTTIEKGTFNDCPALQSIKIGKNVATINGNPFTGCSSLTSLTVEKGNPNYYSVDNCIIDKKSKILIKGGKNSIIPSDLSVTTIGESAFECVPLTSVDIPKGITAIEDRAFAQIDTLKSVNIPEGVTKIGTNAFIGCVALEKVYIPSSVSSIGDYVFTYCNKLVIYGTNGSYAQTYAKANKIKFVSSSHTHSYSEWSKTKESSCTENGSQQRICSSCGSVETKTITAVGHDLENIKITKEATISETGIKEGVCKNCKQTIKETIPCSSVDNKTGATFETVKGVLDSGAKIEIKEIKTGSETYKLIQNSLKEISTKFIAYDITAVLNGAEIQPNGSIKITLKIPNDFSQNVAIYYVADDGKTEKLESTVNADGTISADITHFSSYVICDLDSAGTTDSDNITQKQSNKNNVFLILTIIVILIAISVAVFIFIKRKNTLFKREKTQI